MLVENKPITWTTTFGEMPPSLPEISGSVDELDGYETRPLYLDYLSRKIKDYESTHGFLPRKLIAHRLLQQSSLGDPDTRMTPYQDQTSAHNVVKKLLDTGRRHIWIGTCIANDHTDPRAVLASDKMKQSRGKLETAKLFRGKDEEEKDKTGINKISDFPIIWDRITRYVHDPETPHEGLWVKIFPQDEPMSFFSIASDAEKIQILIKANDYTGRDNGRRDINFELGKLDSSPSGFVIFGEPATASYLSPLINSLQQWRELNAVLKEAKLDALQVFNPEGFIETPDDDWNKGNIAYFTDLIWGVQQPGNKKALDLQAAIAALPHSPFMPRSAKNLVMAIEKGFPYLTEASQGTPSSSSEVTNFLLPIAQLGADTFEPQLLQRLGRLGQAITTHHLNPLNGQSLTPTKRLNMLMEQEKPSAKDVEILLGYVKTAPALQDLLDS